MVTHIFAFVIWILMGCLFVGFGIAAYHSDKPVGFWNTCKIGEVTDTKKYNCAMGKLWCIAGPIFMVLGLPMLAEQNSPIVFVSVAGALIWVISLMIIYELGIMRKYRKK